MITFLRSVCRSLFANVSPKRPAWIKQLPQDLSDASTASDEIAGRDLEPSPEDDSCTIECWDDE